MEHVLEGIEILREKQQILITNIFSSAIFFFFEKMMYFSSSTILLYLRNSLVECNTILSAFTLYRHLE